jgi:hypothetical protein
MNMALVPSSGSPVLTSPAFEGEFSEVTARYSGKGLVLYRW